MAIKSLSNPLMVRGHTEKCYNRKVNTIIKKAPVLPKRVPFAMPALTNPDRCYGGLYLSCKVDRGDGDRKGGASHDRIFSIIVSGLGNV